MLPKNLEETSVATASSEIRDSQSENHPKMSKIICTIINFTSYEPLKVKMALIKEPPRTDSHPL